MATGDTGTAKDLKAIKRILVAILVIGLWFLVAMPALNGMSCFAPGGLFGPQQDQDDIVR